MNFSLKVEFLAGTDLEDAIKQASNFAEKLGVAYITFNFNGVSMSIPQNADISSCITEYYQQVKNPSGFVVGDRRNKDEN